MKLWMLIGLLVSVSNLNALKIVSNMPEEPKIFITVLYGSLINAPLRDKIAQDGLLPNYVENIKTIGKSRSRTGKIIGPYPIAGLDISDADAMVGRKGEGFGAYAIDLRAYPKEELEGDLAFSIVAPGQVIEYFKNVARKILEPGKGLLSEDDLKKMRAAEEPEKKSSNAGEALSLDQQLAQALEKNTQCEKELSAAKARIRELEGAPSATAGSGAIG